MYLAGLLTVLFRTLLCWVGPFSVFLCKMGIVGFLLGHTGPVSVFAGLFLCVREVSLSNGKWTNMGSTDWLKNLTDTEIEIS